MPFQVLLVTGHPLSQMSMFEQSAKACLIGSIAGQHIQSATKSLTTQLEIYFKYSVSHVGQESWYDVFHYSKIQSWTFHNKLLLKQV